jgi:hypothetical protein
VRDKNGQAIAYVYYGSTAGRRPDATLFTKDEERRIAANIAKLPKAVAPKHYCGKPQLYQSLVQYIIVGKAFCSTLAARSSASSGISKVRISSSPSASLVISLFMASTPLVLAPIHAYTNGSYSILSAVTDGTP